MTNESGAAGSGERRPRSPRRPRSRSARIVRAWRDLAPERRLAASASLGLFLTLFLPWYRETVVTAGKVSSAALTGWNAFSFVEAAVLLVAAAVLTLLFERADGRAFHLPGGDGWVVTAAGAWTCVLVVWRILDKQGAHVSGPGAAVSGVEWGIFVALAVAALLAYAGNRIRGAAAPEPPLPEDDLDFSLPSRRSRSRAGRSGSPAAAARRPVTPAASTGASVRTPPPPRRRTQGSIFPVPEPPADPPTLRFGDRRARSAPAEEPPEEPTQVLGSDAAPTRILDDQLTIPFEDGERA